MARFVKVATTDELEDQQAKLVEVAGQKHWSLAHWSFEKGSLPL